MTDQEIFDAHLGLPYNVYMERKKNRKKVLEEDFLGQLKDGNIRSGVASIYIDSDDLPGLATFRALEKIQAFKNDVKESEQLEVAESITQLKEYRKQDKYCFLLGLEGAEPLQGSLQVLEALYNLGIRRITLTHSRRNLLATGASTELHGDEREGGLSDFGVDAVEKMNELGMAVDISHLNKDGFWDVIEVSKDPVIASHSNCRNLCDNPRNLSDEQLKAVADSGGVVGLVSGVDDFVKEGDATLEDFLDHMDHMVKLLGVDSVGLGLDYWEFMEKYFEDQITQSWGTGIEGMSNFGEVSVLGSKIEERGYTEQEREKILHKNFRQTLKHIID